MACSADPSKEIWFPFQANVNTFLSAKKSMAEVVPDAQPVIS
jgi:hypothetical protein